MARSQGAVYAVVAGVAVVLAVVITYFVVAAPPTPTTAASNSPTSSATPGGGGRNGVLITAFHIITEVNCTTSTADVPASWTTRNAQTVSFEVDGQPLPAAAGYPVTGTGNVPVPCDGAEHLVTLVAGNAEGMVARSQHVNTQNAPPPAGGPTVTAFQVLGHVSCAGGQPVSVAAAWATQNATAVSFSVDGQPLSAAAGYPTTGTGNIPVPCDGRAHKVTLTAANAANAQSALSRSVNTEPYAPVPPPTSTTPTTPTVPPTTPTTPTPPTTPTTTPATITPTG